MEEMTVRREIEIEAPPEQVWPVVATQEGVEMWWESWQEVTLEEQLDGHFELRGAIFGTPYYMAGRVVTYDPPWRFAITWNEQDLDGNFWPADTTVAVTLTGGTDGTRVTLEHSGFQHLPEEYRERVFKGYQQGWTDEDMERLRRLVLEQMA